MIQAIFFVELVLQESQRHELVLDALLLQDLLGPGLVDLKHLESLFVFLDDLVFDMVVLRDSLALLR